MSVRITKAQMLARIGQLSSENGVLTLALQATQLEAPQTSERVFHDGWSYVLDGYRLTAPHGGLVVIRARCLTNNQTDAISAYYLDDLPDRFRGEVPLLSAVEKLKVKRQQFYDMEAAS